MQWLYNNRNKESNNLICAPVTRTVILSHLILSTPYNPSSYSPHLTSSPPIASSTELERCFFANNSVIIASATMTLDQNLVRLTP